MLSNARMSATWKIFNYKPGEQGDYRIFEEMRKERDLTCGKN
jgi:hypothetical protein